ncbi:MAG TPA: hypothetical protein VL860_13575, partial [Planctomycetota bacterium]|nr:hypothetical protein [Planctomycetota bacterium]
MALATLLTAGCGSETAENEQAQGGENPAPSGEVKPVAPAPRPVRNPSTSTLPPVEWVELTRAPEIEGLQFPADVLNSARLLVVAVPLADFPVQTQGTRSYRHAIFRDWTLTGTEAAPQGGATSGALTAIQTTCLAAVSGTSGQLSVARQRNFTTGKTEIADASLTGDVAAFYLLFQIGKDVTPESLQYQGKPLHSCAAEPAPELINKLFLPVRPPGVWVNDVLDLDDHPVAVGSFGTLQKLVRKPELIHVDAQGQTTHLKAADGKQFVECWFAPRTAAFDYRSADWHLGLADSSNLEPYGLSVNGGKGYYLKLTEGKGFVGQPATLPVLLFEVPVG